MPTVLPRSSRTASLAPRPLRRRLLSWSGLLPFAATLTGTLAGALLAPSSAHAEAPLSAKPAVIRLGSPYVGTGNRPVGSYNTFSTAQSKGLIEQAFRAEGIRVEWNNFKGAGPALNEAVANGLIDVFWEGELPAIVGKAGGLPTRVVLADNRRIAYGVAVPADSPAQTIDDLKGKKFAVFKGTANQLGFAKFLSRNGLSERDFRVINMDSNTSIAALSTKDVDAVFLAPASLYTLENRGVARVIYNGRQDSQSARLAGQGYILVTEDFERRYPQVVQRIVNVLVREAAWSSDPNNRDALFQQWAKSGTPFASFKREFEGQDLKTSLNPVLDRDFIESVRANVQQARELKLVRGNVDVEAWLSPRYLSTALSETHLQDFWSSPVTSAKAGE